MRRSGSRFNRLLSACVWIMGGLVSQTLVTQPVSAAAPAERKPNVILILADDLGWADLSCYGSQFHQTPHLDRLATNGVRFTQAYAACPVCSPSRAALLTGRYPQRFQLTDWLPGRPDQPAQRLKRPELRQELPLEAVTIAESLQAAGYATGHIGKWHLGGQGFSPLEQGFQSNIGGDQTGTPLSYFAPFQRNGRFMPGLERAAEGEYLTDRYGAEAEAFIERHRTEPFFLFLAHNAVHTPLQAPEERVARFRDGATQRGVGTQRNPVYAAMLSSLDDAVGRVLQKLEALDLTDETLVIFTSDNGGLATLEGMTDPATINSPLREGKGYLYEGGIRVPLIMSWPGRIAAAVNPAVVSGLDLCPTILQICGVDSPDGLDGTSLVPLVTEEKPVPDRALYWHYPHYANQGSRPGGAIRAGDYKLIEYYETGRQELFNVAQDVGEGRNLAADQPERVQQLAGQLAHWRQSVGALEMTPNPDYRPNPQLADGTVVLPASRADVTGIMLRYEPLPHKNTLGYWVRMEDTAHWVFELDRPGKFTVEVLQGCGTGSGGSEVELTVGDQRVVMTVEDTGHFQNFKPRQIGEIELRDVGRMTLNVKPLTKPGVAVMDLRQVRLIPR